MLLPGIKLGPKDWLQKLNESQAQYVEIWYRVDKPEWYIEMFKELQRRGVTFGLHFWGATLSGHEVNLAYPLGGAESAEIIDNCLKIGASWGASYVNIHSGNTARFKLDLTTLSFEQDQTFPQISNQDAETTRQALLESLSITAHELNIALLVEPIPAKTPAKADQHPAPIESLIDPCKRNLIGFTNDFCHLFAYYYAAANPLESFKRTTADFIPHTHVCHINTLWEPYDGADAHGGIMAGDYAKPGVFPDQDQLIKLLKLYKDLPQDVFLIGEPSDNHVENYQVLKELVASL